jgi:hypothetical protein
MFGEARRGLGSNFATASQKRNSQLREEGSAKLTSGACLRDRIAAYNGAARFAVMDGQRKCDDFVVMLFQHGKLTSLLRGHVSTFGMFHHMSAEADISGHSLTNCESTTLN